MEIYFGIHNFGLTFLYLSLISRRRILPDGDLGITSENTTPPVRRLWRDTRSANKVTANMTTRYLNGIKLVILNNRSSLHYWA